MEGRALFLDLSVPLTGFDRLALEGTGLVDTYFRTLQRQADATELAAFWQAGQHILRRAGQHPALLDALLRVELFPASAFGGLAQNIVFLWYCGQWQPTVDAPGANLATVKNVSAQTYVQGLVWLAAQTHPPGAKQPGFGSWARPPATV